MLAKLSLCMCLVACLSLTAFSQDDCEPITKENLLRSFEQGKRQQRTAAQYIDRVYRCGVNFPVTSQDAQEIRRVGRYLGKRGLDDLIDALRQSLRVSVPTRTPRLVGSTAPFALGTELLGIDTLARAHVQVVIGTGIQEDSITIHIKNNSTSGTITNIGFFVKELGLVGRGEQINGPGRYELFAEGQSIETKEFTVRSSFSFETTTQTGDRPRSFKKGFTESGIPPGETTTLRVFGNFRFLGVGNRILEPAQLERGVVLCFQDVGENHQSDLALFPRREELYSAVGSFYKIGRTRTHK
jgi:hypothetical protein